MTKKFLFILLTVFPFFTFALNKGTIEVFEKNESQIELAKEIIETLESNHLVKIEYSSIQSEAFAEYLERLDPNKTIFTLPEIDIFFERINQSLNIEEDLNIAFDVFNKYADRYLLRYDTQNNFLNQLNEENLNSSRTLIRDLSESTRQNNLKDLENLWVDLSTNDAIQLMLSGNSLDIAVEKTRKRMDNQLNFFKQTSQKMYLIYS